MEYEKIILDLEKLVNIDTFGLDALLAVAQKALENKSEITGIPTGFYDLDKVTSGLHAGEMIIIAARPGMGKTAFALNIAQYVATHDKVPVAVSSNRYEAAKEVIKEFKSEILLLDDGLQHHKFESVLQEQPLQASDHQSGIHKHMKKEDKLLYEFHQYKTEEVQ